MEASGLFTYPDISVVCGGLQFVEGTTDTAINPTVIVEVLSDSTEAYDRGRKFENYRQIPMLRACILVSQYEPHVDQFTRTADGVWALSEAKGLGATLDLAPLGIRLELAEIYANVSFKPPTLRVESVRPGAA